MPKNYRNISADKLIEYKKLVKQALVSARAQNHLSQSKVSACTGIPIRTLSRYEQGVNIPSITQAEKLSELYGVLPRDLLCMDQYPEESDERVSAREAGIKEEELMW